MRYLSASDQPVGSTRTLLKETGDDGQVASVIRRTVLPGGLRVVTEAMPGARSTTLGLWTGVGSRDESRSLAGATHFLEHLLFKGTRRRTALDISAELDAVGGELNAFTGKEYTCYHARVLDADVPLAVDVLCDMVTSSVLPTVEVESERNVILEEIAMHDDDHDEVVHDAFVAALYGDTPLGRSITGTPDSINGLTRQQISGYYHRRYTADRLVFSAAGSVDHRALVKLVTEAFLTADALGDEARTPSPVRRLLRQPVNAARSVVIERPAEQTTFVMGLPAFPRNDPRRFALGVLNAALGGGTSSRLFQEVRERRGLAYSVYSFAEHHVDAGLVGVAAGCLPRRYDDLLATVRAELARVAAEGIDEAELARGQGQLRAGVVLGLEDSTSRMARLAKAELVYDQLLGVDDLLERIDAVTLPEVRDLARQLFTQRELLAVVGPGR
ncbi:MAG: M16 family metallopeptidase [Nocardioidaceae bacterium]